MKLRFLALAALAFLLSLVGGGVALVGFLMKKGGVKLDTRYVKAG